MSEDNSTHILELLEKVQAVKECLEALPETDEEADRNVAKGLEELDATRKIKKIYKIKRG